MPLACSDAPVAHDALDAGTGVVMGSSLPTSDAGVGPSDASAPPALTLRADAPALCARPATDLLRDIFCGTDAPVIQNLRDFETLIGVSPDLLSDAGSDDAGQATGSSGYTYVEGDAGADSGVYVQPNIYVVSYLVMIAHSTSLTGRTISPLNPRAIVFANGTIMAYQRGVQQIELVTQAYDTGALHLYLLTFEQACNQQPGGCTPGELYTPEVERNWLKVTLQDDEDLKNTPFDCRSCHQRGRSYPDLLMRELESPWTHFFEPAPAGQPPLDLGMLPGTRGHDLVEEFASVRGDERYGGISTEIARHTVGFVLQSVVPPQPLLFEAPEIESELYPKLADGGFPAAPVPSPTWEAGYAAFKRGEQLALPYHDVRVTDMAKQAALSDAYARYRAGELPAAELPDLADIFPDDPMTRARIGLQTEPGATPAEALVQACGSCHNDVLDQTISRARFNVRLASMSRAELDVAIDRLQRKLDDPLVMPPRDARRLDTAGLTALVSYLRANQRSAEDDAFLSHAADAGMLGGNPDVSY